MGLCCFSDREDSRKGVLEKSGRSKVVYCGLGTNKLRLLTDTYLTLLESHWSFLVIFVACGYLSIYLAFAGIWYALAYKNGDLDNDESGNHTTCLYGVVDFSSALLYSIETLTSIGYGALYPNPLCPFNIPLVFIESTIGFWCETVLLSLIFVKLARPKGRSKTLIFSKRACISMKNGELLLHLRVADIRDSHLVSTKISGMVVKSYTTDEGVLYPLYQHEAVFEANYMDAHACLIWPLVLTHVISKDSPLYGLKRKDTDFEVIVFIEGTIESTGEGCQTRTSFTASEIVWGREFMRMEDFDVEKKRWNVNFGLLNKMVKCSEFEAHVESTDGLKSCLEECDEPVRFFPHVGTLKTHKVVGKKRSSLKAIGDEEHEIYDEHYNNVTELHRDLDDNGSTDTVDLGGVCGNHDVTNPHPDVSTKF